MFDHWKPGGSAGVPKKGQQMMGHPKIGDSGPEFCSKSNDSPWPWSTKAKPEVQTAVENKTPDRRASKMRLFHLLRLEDASGVSGTGVVAEGVEFTDGTVCMNWLTKMKCTAVYANIRDLEAIHGHGGRTIVVWLP